MKKFECFVLVCILIIAGIGGYVFIDAMNSWKNESNIYPATMIVDTIDKHFDTVVIRDSIGNLWEFKGIEDWEIGDICSVIMNDNETPDNIYDDEIVRVRYAGTKGDF